MSPVTPPGGEADDNRRPGRIAGLERESARDRRQPHDRADREIDAARRDDRGHAERHDADEREIAGDVVEIVGGGEGRRLQLAHHDADER